MGSLAAYRGGSIYLDTNVFIYAVPPKWVAPPSFPMIVA